MPAQQEEKHTKNTVTIEQAGPCRKKIIVEIPKETISKLTDEQYEIFRRDALVPGFRKGRAPRRLLEKRFGKDVGEQIKLKLLADASDAAIKDNKLDILREPEINHEKIELPADGPLKFDFEVEVRPEFELPAIEGIPVNKTKLEVTDGHIDREIEMLCKYAGTWTPKESGKVELEDQVVADVMLKIGEQEQKVDNTEIQVRPNGFVADVPIEKLDELLVGAKSGDVKTTEINVPKTYFKEELRGKSVEIKITVKDIKWLKPAELNQDLITKCGVASEDELRKAIRQRLQGRLESQAQTEMAEQIYTYLLDNTTFDLPVDVVADQAVSLLRRQYIDLMMQGLQKEQIDQHIEQLKSSSEQQAQQQLKVFFIMDKVAEKLGIKTTEEEVNGHIAQLAIQKKIRPERLKEEMQRDGSLAQFTSQVRDQKSVAKMLESAKITEVEAKPHKHAEPKPKPAQAKAEPAKHAASPKGSAAASKKTADKPAEKEHKKAAAHAKHETPKAHPKASAEKKSDKKTGPTTRKKKT
ncbi:MAG: trigger factor [Sedimentisphaerales bacterium]|jgi:trigger factor